MKISVAAYVKELGELLSNTRVTGRNGEVMSPGWVSFLGNAVGAPAGKIAGNKKPIEKCALLQFIRTLLK
ncbi:MAG: hypothetical protein JXL84_25325 [Deltaproteobacteria bacterium]|nr:hypothetical protein [Deltaproteobacteria bacterium]